jgi:protein SCO1
MGSRPPMVALVVSCVLVLLVGGLGWSLVRPAHAPNFHSTEFTDIAAAPEFSLVDHAGRPASLRDFEGRVVLLFFGFTHCPDVCPLTLTRLSRIREALGRQGEQIEILLVTVDPERDTPAVLADYVARFGPGVRGLTGDAEALAAAKAGYGVHATATHMDGTSHGLAHTDAIYGIDRRGRLRALIAPDAPEDQLRDDIVTLLRL